MSGDSHFVHLAWRKDNPQLRNLGYPMLADYRKELAEELGILDPMEKVPLRATYIVDPDGMIRWLSVNALSVGRNTGEILRELQALQTGELCPANWTLGEATLERSSDPEKAVHWETTEHLALR